MKVRLNGTRIRIKPASMLTASEYVELMQFKKVTILEYLAVVTGLQFSEVARNRMKDWTERRLKNYIGNIENYKSLQQLSIDPENFFFERTEYNRKDSVFVWDAVGARIMLENKATETTNEIELAIYLLATMLEGTYDADKVQELYIKLLDCNYLEIIPFALFFFIKLKAGSRKNRKLLNIFRRVF